MILIDLSINRKCIYIYILSIIYFYSILFYSISIIYTLYIYIYIYISGEQGAGMLTANCSLRSVFLIFHRPPLWSSGQSSWLQIQTSGFDSRRYQIFWDVVGLERGPLNFVSTNEELLGRKDSGSGLENREYGCGNQSRWIRGNLCRQKLALTSPTSDGRSGGIVRSRTQATEFNLSSLGVSPSVC
jgi:hypothetical protein